jgi:hypothetical protein
MIAAPKRRSLWRLSAGRVRLTAKHWSARLIACVMVIAGSLCWGIHGKYNLQTSQYRQWDNYQQAIPACLNSLQARRTLVSIFATRTHVFA